MLEKLVIMNNDINHTSYKGMWTIYTSWIIARKILYWFHSKIIICWKYRFKYIYRKWNIWLMYILKLEIYHIEIIGIILRLMSNRMKYQIKELPMYRWEFIILEYFIYLIFVISRLLVFLYENFPWSFPLRMFLQEKED